VAEVIDASSSASSADHYATGFFVMLVAPVLPNGTTFSYSYFVTAKHIAEDLKGKPIAFLVNQKGEGIKTINLDEPKWITHPTDLSADVAVVPFPSVGGLDILCVSTNEVLTPEAMKKLNIGIGDEVFMTGLFTPAPGVKRNMPIVRYGTIAMIPDEQMDTELGYADVYLVEARSIGGISGSPVFARQSVPGPVMLVDGIPVTPLGVGPFGLLGMAQGHWDIKESEMNKSYFTHDRKRGVNMGIGIVVPAYKILETINHPTLVDFRAKHAMKITKRFLPTPESSLGSKERE
jgi:hypothetical protein